MSRSPTLPADEIAADVFRVRDTCNVYVLRRGSHAIAIDFGSGAVLDGLAELGVERLTDVLVTHHHRDQVQGLSRAAEAGARIWAPPVERDLIANVERHWVQRQFVNDYDVRQDRFSLLDSVPIAGCAAEYRSKRVGAFDVYTLPTPGHTIGSVTYLLELGGRRFAFCGDLIYAPGKIWSVAATQWSYTGVEGQAATALSCRVLAARQPDVLLPSHGDPVGEPAPALRLVHERFAELVSMRMEEPWDLDDWLDRPWVEVSPHLLRNRTSFATTYALLSVTGKALLLDFGYDLSTGPPPPTERAARRPLLTTLDSLRRDFGVERVDVVVPTHYHDDHVAGINLLREVEGAAVWAPDNVAPVLEAPSRYDLPCLWFDAIPVDRVLRENEPVTWCEHELTTHALPGHTLYAAAIAFEVDGKRVLAVGDQDAFTENGFVAPNYQYRNRFRIDDYVRSAELYRRLRPDLLLTGHWSVREVDAGMLDRLARAGARIAELHRELLPLDDVDLGAEGFAARIEPYRTTAPAAAELVFDVHLRNPFARAASAEVRLIVPDGWNASPEAHELELGKHGAATASFEVKSDGSRVFRARVAADVAVDGVAFGQQAEALVTLE